MFGPLENAGMFLLQTLFDLYILVLMLRVLLAFFGAEIYNPVVQLFVKLTDPVIKPLRFILPRLRSFDLAGVVAIILFTLLKFASLYLIQFGTIPNPLGFSLLCLGDILKGIIYIFMIAIFIRILLSWFSPQAQNPVTPLLLQLTEPLMAPARRLIKPMGGMDFSPIIVILALNVLIILINGYIG